MGPLAGQLLLESLLAPFVLASMVMVSARRIEHGRLESLLPALAIALAVGATYILAFGWPPNLTAGARTKILLSIVIGFAAGLILDRRAQWSRLALAAGAIGIPLWIGASALHQGRPESALLLLPVAAALALLLLMGRGPSSAGTSRLLMVLTLAIGLAAIAAFAKALSFAELGLALGGALLAILTVGRKPLAMPAVAMATAMLLALASALLLYSEASLLALFVLAAVIGAERFAHLSIGDQRVDAPIPRVLLFCLLPSVAAVIIARIDAGPISIY